MGLGKRFDHEALQTLLQGSVDDKRDLDRYAASNRVIDYPIVMLSDGVNPVPAGGVFRGVRANGIFTAWFNFYGPWSPTGTTRWTLQVPYAFREFTDPAAVIGQWIGTDAAGTSRVFGYIEKAHFGAIASYLTISFGYLTANPGAETYAGSALPWTWVSATNRLNGYFSYECADSFTP